MADTVESIPAGTPIVLSVEMKAKKGKETELREYLQKLRARALSSEEPDTLQYEVAEYDGTFALWEAYTSSAAHKKHQEDNPIWLEFEAKLTGDDALLSGPVLVKYYPANTN